MWLCPQTATLHVLKKSKAVKEVERAENGGGDAAVITDDQAHSHGQRGAGESGMIPCM
jgi:hypothetical protein